jgi:hypothetical protein
MAKHATKNDGTSTAEMKGCGNELKMQKGHSGMTSAPPDSPTGDDNQRETPAYSVRRCGGAYAHAILLCFRE